MRGTVKAVTLRLQANTLSEGNNRNAPLLVLGDYNDVPDHARVSCELRARGTIIGFRRTDDAATLTAWALSK